MIIPANHNMMNDLITLHVDDGKKTLDLSGFEPTSLISLIRCDNDQSNYLRQMAFRYIQEQARNELIRWAMKVVENALSS